MKKYIFYTILFLFLWTDHSKPSDTGDFSDWWSTPRWITQAKNWFNNLSQEKRNKMYEGVRTHASNTITPEYGQELVNRVLPYEYLWSRVDPLYQKFKQEIAKDLGWGAGIIAVAGATYGLYRWAVRRGLGGLVRDFQDSDRKNTAILHQFDTKIRALNIKKELTPQDLTLAKGMKTLIASKIDDLKAYSQQLANKSHQLDAILHPKKLLSPTQSDV